ncbi:MAG: hypothetical protein ACOYLG_07610 [Chitinophagaceae bacterium]
MQPKETCIQQLIRNTLKYKYLIVFLALIPAISIGIYTKSEKGKYLTYAKIFPLSFNSTPGGGTFASIKAQLGISDKTDYDKIYNLTELIKSKTISLQVVKFGCSNKKYKNIAAWLIDDHNRNLKMFAKKIQPDLKDTNDFYFAAADVLLENTEVIVEKTDFTKIVTGFHDKELSKEVNEAILKNLSSFYIKLATEKPSSEVKKLEVIRDSLKDELNALEKAIAGFQDSNQLSVKYSSGIPQAKLLRTRAEVEQLYVTAVTAYQNASFKLLSESPIFQVLDFPGAPYEFKKSSWAKIALIVFFAFIIFFMSMFNTKIILSIIKEELAKN